MTVRELWWACDTNDRKKELEPLERARELFWRFPKKKMRCYTMIGYQDETLEQAAERIQKVFDLGFMPFSQLYQPADADHPIKTYSAEWKALNRKWARPAAYMSEAANP